MGPAYAPEMLASVWLYAYALGVTSSRRLEQRIREDLAFHYLAGGAAPDHWTLNAFRRRRAKGLNDLFTQVVELARKAKLGKLGHVAIDSTRIAANASRNRVDTEQALRDARARIRRDIRREQRLAEFLSGWSGCINRACTRCRGPIRTAVSARARRIHAGLHRHDGGQQDHFIVARRVTQETNDNELLLPMVDLVEQRCGEKPQRASADSGFFSVNNLHALEERKIDAYVPDSNLARWSIAGAGSAAGPAIRHITACDETAGPRGGIPGGAKQSSSRSTSSQRAAGDAAVPPTPAGKSCRGVGADHHRV